MRKYILAIFLALSTLCTVSAAQPEEVRPLRFVWGAAINGGIEMSGHDMSTVGINAEFGMQWKWVRFFGVNAEADIMTANSSRTFPLSVNFRTDFSDRRRLLFMDLRGGIALNYLDNQPQQSDPYGSAGIGVTLAKGKTFASHLIVAYSYLGRKECHMGTRLRKCPGMSYATMRIGVNF